MRDISKEPWLRTSLTTMGRGPIWASTSNVRLLGRSRASAGSLRSRNSAVCITVMNALQRNDMSADAFLAKVLHESSTHSTTLFGLVGVSWEGRHYSVALNDLL